MKKFNVSIEVWEDRENGPRRVIADKTIDAHEIDITQNGDLCFRGDKSIIALFAPGVWLWALETS